MYTDRFFSAPVLLYTCFISTRSLLIMLHRRLIYIMLTGNQYSWIVTNGCGSVLLNVNIVDCMSWVKLHWLRYTTFPTSDAVLVLQGVWSVSAGRNHPSQLEALYAYQSNSLRGREDVFCLVQLSPLTLHGGQNNMNSNEYNFFVQHQNPDHTLPLLSANISLLSWLHLPLLFSHLTHTCNPFSGYSIPTLLSHLLTWCSCSCYQAFTPTETLFHLIKPQLSPFLSPVQPLLLRVVQQHSDDVEEAAQHF